MPGGPAATGPGIGANAPKNKLTGVLMVSFAAFGGILFGYDTGVISGIIGMPNWLQTFGTPTSDTAKHPSGYELKSTQESLTVSILSAGTFVGALAAGPIGDTLGRRLGIVLACAIFSVGVAMQTASTGLGLFIGGRVVAGLGVGIVSCLVPMYQSECAPKWIRGAVVSCYQWAITIGLLLASIVNNGTKDRTNHSSYRIPIALQFVWAFILTTGMLALPESPRWLVKQGRDGEAAHSLARLTSLSATDPEVETELEEIRANMEAELKLGEASYLDCFKHTDNKILLRTLTGIFIQAWQQLTGINFIFYYGTTFFLRSGIKNSFVINIITNVVNVCMTIPGMWGIERFGRRRLLIVGAAGMALCEYIVAIVGVTISTDNKAGQQVLIAFVCIYIAFFASTWGPVAWVITGEIFPLVIRAKAMSMAVASNWLWNFAIGYSTPYLVNEGKGSAGLGVKVFFIWGTTCFCCIIFTYFCIPETKGLSLEQIDVLYKHTVPHKAHEYRRQLMADSALNAADRDAELQYDDQHLEKE